MEAEKSRIVVRHINCYSDNYAYFVFDGKNKKECMMVDVPEFGPIKKFLALPENKDFQISHILCTHKHGDHVGGAKEMVKFCAEKYGKKPVVIAGKEENLKFVTMPISKKTTLTIGEIKVLMTVSPCHTKGHLLYYMQHALEKDPNQGCIFTGDTLFLGGCGRFFEGNGQQMARNFDYLRTLPDPTAIYDGHEYTLQSLGFGAGIETGFQEGYQTYYEACKKRLAQGLPSGPGTIRQEKLTNIFMRANLAHLQKICGSTDSGEVTATLRKWKNDGKVLKKPAFL